MEGNYSFGPGVTKMLLRVVGTRMQMDGAITIKTVLCYVRNGPLNHRISHRFRNVHTGSLKKGSWTFEEVCKSKTN